MFSVCRAGEVWSQCASCEPTCADPNPRCTKECRPAACQCAPGLVRHPITRTCIKPEICNVTICPIGEIWNPCATCEPSCADPNPICTKECRPAACQCAPGLVRHPITKTCIKLEQCKAPTPRCGFNEKAEVCPAACNPGCQCAAGHVRFIGVCLSETICRRYY
ncbi:unnamed protein product [Auanema sp. JU1783]|nr:unnamed protein product [Auanema sp. JU1783]